MLKRIAIIKNLCVTNIALWDSEDVWNIDADMLIDVTERPKVRIGSAYDPDSNVFASELETPPEEE